MDRGRSRRSRGGRGGGIRQGLKDMIGGNRRHFADEQEEQRYAGTSYASRYHDDRSPQATGCFSRILPAERNNYGATDGTFRRGRGDGGGGRSVMQRVRDVGRSVMHQDRDTRRQVNLTRTVAGRAAQAKMWNRVTIQKGVTFGKEFIYRSLGAYVDGEIFWPLLYTTDKFGQAMFHLLSDDVAQAVKVANRRITDPRSGMSMNVEVRKFPMPFAIANPVEPDHEECLKRVLSKRYDTVRKHLNLSKFTLDPEFLEHGYQGQMSLQRNQVMMAVCTIIAHNCPDVISINAQNNRLRFLDYLGNLVPVTKELQVLDLKMNQIEKTYELEKLRGWSLLEIELDENPICTQYNDQPSYVSAIHHVFPKVRKLDGVDVQPSQMAHEVDGTAASSTQLPPVGPGFYINAEVQRLVEAFVRQFYVVYDDADPEKGRKQLMLAYDDNAVFTLTITPLDARARYQDGALYADYRRESHNIQLEDRWAKFRSKIVAKGSLNVVARLCRMPRTEHLADSMIVDVSFMLDNLLSFTVNGLFRDGDDVGTESKDTLRFFSRTYLCVPKEDGTKLAIVNEELFISPMTADGAEAYYVHLAKANRVALDNNIAGPNIAVPTPQPQLNAAPVAPTAVVVSPEQQREQLLVEFARATGMKPDWALKCLSDNDFDGQKAFAAFQQNRARLPAAAFA